LWDRGSAVQPAPGILPAEQGKPDSFVTNYRPEMIRIQNYYVILLILINNIWYISFFFFNFDFFRISKDILFGGCIIELTASVV
jgi:hypothetical protein